MALEEYGMRYKPMFLSNMRVEETKPIRLPRYKNSRHASSRDQNISPKSLNLLDVVL